MKINSNPVRLLFAKIFAADINEDFNILDDASELTARKMQNFKAIGEFSDISVELSKAREIFEFLRHTFDEFDEKFGQNLNLLNDLTLADTSKINECAKDFSENFRVFLVIARIGKNSQKFYEDFVKNNITFDRVGVVLLLAAIIKLHLSIQAIALGLVQKMIRVAHAIQVEQEGFIDVKIKYEVPPFEDYGNRFEVFEKICECAMVILEVEEAANVNNKADSFSSEYLLSNEEVLDQDNLDLQNILLWILQQKNLTTSDLARKISKAGLFPSALISQINELSLDLSGELAMTENKGEISIHEPYFSDLIETIAGN